MRNTAAFLRDVQGELWCYHVGYMQIFAGFNSSVKNLMNRYKVHFVEISTEGDYVKDLMGLFR